MQLMEYSSSDSVCVCKPFLYGICFSAPTCLYTEVLYQSMHSALLCDGLGLSNLGGYGLCMLQSSYGNESQTFRLWLAVPV